MNCKPGDLAVVVKSIAGNEGRIVRCIRLDPMASSLKQIDAFGRIYPPEPYWEIDIALPDFSGQMNKSFADEQLRPIRDPGDDAQDESLSWLPVPSRDEVTA